MAAAFDRRAAHPRLDVDCPRNSSILGAGRQNLGHDEPIIAALDPAHPLAVVPPAMIACCRRQPAARAAARPRAERRRTREHREAQLKEGACACAERCDAASVGVVSCASACKEPERLTPTAPTPQPCYRNWPRCRDTPAGRSCRGVQSRCESPRCAGSQPPRRAAAMRVTQICLRGSARVRAATAAGLPIIPLPSTARQRCALPLIIHHRLTITSSNVASSQRPSPSSLAPVSTISAWVPAAGATPSPADPLASLGPCPAFLDLTAAESPVSSCRLHVDAVRLHFAPLQSSWPTPPWRSSLALRCFR